MTISERAALEFLGLRRLAVVGASDDPEKFGNTIYKELKSHGYDVVAVNKNAALVDGDAAFPTVTSIPEPVDGVVVMVKADAALDVIDDCAAAGVKRVWLFKGAGPGAVSADTVARCEQHGIEVVAGACPLMFLEPVAWFHKFHRTIRHLNGSLRKAA
jgi:uncharacterized protein